MRPGCTTYTNQQLHIFPRRPGLKGSTSPGSHLLPTRSPGVALNHWRLKWPLSGIDPSKKNSLFPVDSQKTSRALAAGGLSHPQPARGLSVSDLDLAGFSRDQEIIGNSESSEFAQKALDTEGSSMQFRVLLSRPSRFASLHTTSRIEKRPFELSHPNRNAPCRVCLCCLHPNRFQPAVKVLRWGFRVK